MSAATPSSAVEHRNEVHLIGRVAADPTVRVLPSGDELVSVRLVVERPPLATGRGRARIDTMTCVAWDSSARARLCVWRRGDVGEVRGALRRRFWRTEQGPRSRYEIDVSTCARHTCAGNSDDANLSSRDDSGPGAAAGEPAQISHPPGHVTGEHAGANAVCRAGAEQDPTTGGLL